MNSKKKKNNNENFLHYEEAVKDFPFEYELAFGGNYQYDEYHHAMAARLKKMKDKII